MRFSRWRVSAYNALVRVVWIVHVATVSVNKLELLGFAVDECFHGERNFTVFDVQIHSKVIIRLLPLAFVTLGELGAHVVKCFTLADNKAVVDVKDEKADMF